MARPGCPGRGLQCVLVACLLSLLSGAFATASPTTTPTASATAWSPTSASSRHARVPLGLEGPLDRLRESNYWLGEVVEGALRARTNSVSEIAFSMACGPVIECKGLFETFACASHLIELLVLVDLGEQAEAVIDDLVHRAIELGDEATPFQQRQVLNSLNCAMIHLRHVRKGVPRPGGRQRAQALFDLVTENIPYVLWEDPEQVCPVFYPGLRALPWWDAHAHDWLPARELEAAFPAILAEFEGFLEQAGGFQLEGDHDLISEGSWKEFLLFENGMFNESSCAWLPTACAVYGNMKQVTGYLASTRAPLDSQITVFQLRPGTHLRPHTGSHNARLTMHLGLIIPDHVHIRVANDTRTWQQGKVVLFDDSFEHEVWHEGNATRYVIYSTVHHPDYPSLAPEKLVLGPFREGKNLEAARLVGDPEPTRYQTITAHDNDAWALVVRGAGESLLNGAWRMGEPVSGRPSFFRMLNTSRRMELFAHVAEDNRTWWYIQDMEWVNGRVTEFGSVLYGALAHPTEELAVPLTNWEVRSGFFSGPTPAPRLDLLPVPRRPAAVATASVTGCDAAPDAQAFADLDACLAYFGALLFHHPACV